MTSSSFYQRSWQGFLALCLCLLSLHAFAATEAAVILFSNGTVTKVSAADKQPLAKGDHLAAGDTVNTGHDGRVQMRFTDGGLVSLMPNSSFAIDRYNQPDNQDGGSLSFRLVKGGLRTLTGSIGQKNHDNYELKTDVATLGIRGTEFVVVIDGDAMRVQVSEGLITLQNQLGDLMVPAGQNAVVFPQQAPALTDTAPLFVSTTSLRSSASSVADNSGRDSSPIASSSQTNDSLSQSLPAQTMLSPADYARLENHILGNDTGGFVYVSLFDDPPFSRGFNQQALNNMGVTNFAQAENRFINPQFLANKQTVGAITWNYFEDSNDGIYHASFWAAPATNLPTSGTLSYKLMDSGLAKNNMAGAGLEQFELTINLGANPTFGVVMEFESSFNLSINQAGLSGNWTGPGSFAVNQFDHTDGSMCSSSACQVNIAGFLAGPSGAQAATVYKIKNPDLNLNGSAILDKQ